MSDHLIPYANAVKCMHKFTRDALKNVIQCGLMLKVVSSSFTGNTEQICSLETYSVYLEFMNANLLTGSDGLFFLSEVVGRD